MRLNGKFTDNDHNECIKAIRKFHEDVIKGYLEKPNQKLDESIRDLTDDEFFLLSMLVLLDFGGERVTNMNKVIFEEINNAPTVEAYKEKYDNLKEAYKLLSAAYEYEVTKEERPKGVWIVKQERAGAYVGDRAVYSYTCPFCKAKEFKKYPFCHCGADMREAENE